ncbi:MAG TPA: hypothetical protein VFN13_12520 [Rudaea sp.]|nr:hypothetical protein [Rudaea sp.]
MTTDIARILESKRAHRNALAARPIAEKLRLLDALRERELLIRRASLRGAQTIHEVHEDAASYVDKPA